MISEPSQIKKRQTLIPTNQSQITNFFSVGAQNDGETSGQSQRYHTVNSADASQPITITGAQ